MTLPDPSQASRLRGDETAYVSEHVRRGGRPRRLPTAVIVQAEHALRGRRAGRKLDECEATFVIDRSREDKFSRSYRGQHRRRVAGHRPERPQPLADGAVVVGDRAGVAADRQPAVGRPRTGLRRARSTLHQAPVHDGQPGARREGDEREQDDALPPERSSQNPIHERPDGHCACRRRQGSRGQPACTRKKPNDACRSAAARAA